MRGGLLGAPARSILENFEEAVKWWKTDWRGSAGSIRISEGL